MNTAIWNQERFEGILRSFQIDGIPQYPTYTPETSKCVQRISYDGKYIFSRSLEVIRGHCHSDSPKPHFPVEP